MRKSNQLAEYLSNHWFEALNLDKELLNNYTWNFCSRPELDSLTVDFSAFGVLNEQLYFLEHYKKLEAVLRNLNGKELNEFKFKFRGWKEVNPLPLLEMILSNVQTKSLLINLADISGSKEMLLLLFSDMFKSARFYKVQYNLSKQCAWQHSWTIGFDEVKELAKCFAINEPKESMHFDLSGWGRDVFSFFEGTPFALVKDPNFQKNKQQDEKKEQERQQRERQRQLSVCQKELHPVLLEYFTNNVLKSECKEVKIVMEGWHPNFGLNELKANLDEEIGPQKSLMHKKDRLPQRDKETTERLIIFRV